MPLWLNLNNKLFFDENLRNEFNFYFENLKNYLVISLPMTNLWISEVPSPMVQSLESL